MQENGASRELLVEAARYFFDNMEHIVTVDTLEYLYKGGRLSRTSAVVGGGLDILPWRRSPDHCHEQSQSPAFLDPRPAPPQAPILCSDGSRTFCLLCTDIAKAISVHIRQPVREQPDTGYQKRTRRSLRRFRRNPGISI